MPARADQYSRVEGAANYRRVPLFLEGVPLTNPNGEKAHYVYGTGMPNTEGLRSALYKMGCMPDGPRKVMWTSLREVSQSV